MKTIIENFKLTANNAVIRKSILNYEGFDIDVKEVKNSLEIFIEIITGSSCISINTKEITNKNGNFKITIDDKNKNLIIEQIECCGYSIKNDAIEIHI